MCRCKSSLPPCNYVTSLAVRWTVSKPRHLRTHIHRKTGADKVRDSEEQRNHYRIGQTSRPHFQSSNMYIPSSHPDKRSYKSAPSSWIPHLTLTLSLNVTQSCLSTSRLTICEPLEIKIHLNWFRTSQFTESSYRMRFRLGLWDVSCLLYSIDCI